MPEAAQFSYAQARLQARLGARADDRLWRRLQGSGDLTGYLRVAAQSPLRGWTAGLHAGSSSHDIELALRTHFRLQVEEIARWLPARWTGVVRALAELPELPALQHLRAGGIAPAWMLDDPALRRFAGEPPATRADVADTPERAWLAEAWQREDALPLVWYEHWRRLWPSAAAQTAGLEHLGRLLLDHTRAIRSGGGTETDTQRLQLLNRLRIAFRRYSFQPAAACAHLGIVALDLERLRADLVERAVFGDRREAAP